MITRLADTTRTCHYFHLSVCTSLSVHGNNKRRRLLSNRDGGEVMVDGCARASVRPPPRRTLPHRWPDKSSRTRPRRKHAGNGEYVPRAFVRDEIAITARRRHGISFLFYGPNALLAVVVVWRVSYIIRQTTLEDRIENALVFGRTPPRGLPGDDRTVGYTRIANNRI